MAEDYPAAGICGGGNWWTMNAPKSAFMGGGGPSPCSMGIIGNDLGAYGSYNWSSCKDYLWNNIVHSNIIVNNSIEGSGGDHNSMVFQSSQSHPHHHQQQQQQQADSDDHSGGGGGGGSSMLMDSTLQMMGFNLTSSSSSSSPDWNQTLIGNTSSNGRGEAYTAILQEDMNLSLDPSPEIQKDWTSTTSDHHHPTSSTTTGPGLRRGGGDDDDDHFSLDQQIRMVDNNNPTATCQGLSSSGFHMGPSTYGYHSSLIQSLFEPDPISPPPPPHHHHHQQSLLIDNRPSSVNYYEPPPPSCNWPNGNKIPSPPPPLGTRQQQASSSGTGGGGLHFSNNAPYWNASASGSFDDDINGGGNFLPSSQPPQFVPAASALEEKPHCSNLTAKTRNEESARNSGSVAKKGSEPAYKRPRIETPSPLPTFKVRKEKLGDRITALQQLVSPFGKTDTASVLHEAIEYVKYLHDQVNVLSTPYLKNANPVQQQLQQGVDRLNDPEGTRQDLRSRGLCLVPISSTFPVASESTSDFWTPTFGGTFR